MADGLTVDPDRLRAHLHGLAGPAGQATTAGGAIGEIAETNRVGPFDLAYGVINQPFAMVMEQFLAPPTEQLKAMVSSVAALSEHLGSTIEAYTDTEYANTRLIEQVAEELGAVGKDTMRSRPR